jgi:hypothetical protein
MTTKGYWFNSTMFEIEPGEDQETNPGIYGRQLAIWLAEQLRSGGYLSAKTRAEDWGRLIVCAEKPVPLWVGCGNVVGTVNDNGAANAVWHCFAIAEPNFMQRFFSKHATSDAIAKLDSDLESILVHEPRIKLVDEPQ